MKQQIKIYKDRNGQEWFEVYGMENHLLDKVERPSQDPKTWKYDIEWIKTDDEFFGYYQLIKQFIKDCQKGYDFRSSMRSIVNTIKK